MARHGTNTWLEKPFLSGYPGISVKESERLSFFLTITYVIEDSHEKQLRFLCPCLTIV